jgi:drug/metabolite transporter (DMT)-like permease
MIYLILSIIFSVLLLVNFRLHGKYNISTFQAIILNYPVCIITGLLLLPDNQHFTLDLSQNYTWAALALGIGFVITFLLSGYATQRIGMTITSLANNISLVIPVLCSIFIFKVSNNFDWLNYLGLFLAIVAVGLSTYKTDETGENKGINLNDFWLPVAVFIMYGITNTTFNYLNLRFVTDSGQTIPFTLLILTGSVASGSILLIFRLLTKQETFAFRNLIAAFPLGIPNFLSFFFLLKALDAYKNNGAFVLPIYNIGVILASAIVAFIVFKEKLQKLNRWGLVLAVIAIGLISYQGILAI